MPTIHPVGPEYEPMPRVWVWVIGEDHPNPYRRGQPHLIHEHGGVTLAVFSDDHMADLFSEAAGLSGHRKEELPDFAAQADYAEAYIPMGVTHVAYDHVGPPRPGGPPRRIVYMHAADFAADCRRRHAAGEG